MKECSVKYQAAKKAGTLNGENWKAFRAAQCSDKVAQTDAAPPAASATSSPAPAAASTPATLPPTTTAPATGGKVEAPATGNATFPNAVDSKYSSLKAGKGRMKTCADQYRANKASGANGGLKWIQKGGGYYSECTKHLKAV